MNIQDIEIFLDLIIIKNFSDVAAHYNMSQSSISKRIKRLEENVGIKLLNRNNKGVISITKDAQRIIPYFKDILNSKNKIERISKYGNSLYIGISSGINEEFIFNLTIHLKKENYIPYIYIDSSSNIIDKIESNKYDIGIVGYKFEKDGLEFKTLFKEKIGLVGLKKIEKFSLKNIYDIPLIIHQKGSGLREYIFKYLEEKNININKLNIVYEIGYENFTLKSVLNGFGYGFLNIYKLKPPLVNILENQEIERSFWLVGKNNKLLEKIKYWKEVGLL